VPLRVYSMIRIAVTFEVNAVSASPLLLTLGLIVVARLLVLTSAIGVRDGARERH